MSAKKENKKQLSDDQLAKIKKEISENLSLVRHRLLCDMPFIGSLAMRFDLVPVRDARCRTACTDSHTIYWDCDFFSKLSNGERVFVFAHEVYHCVMLHFARKQTRDAKLFNIAADAEVNNLLSESLSAQYKAPENLIFPPEKLKGKSAEVIYDWLLKQRDKNKLKDAVSQMTKDGGSKQGNSSNGGNGCETGKLSGQFDRHEYSGDAAEEEKTCSTPVDQWGEVGFDKDFKPSVSEDAAERMRESVVSAAQQYMRDHGKLPAGIDGLVGKLAKPEISWREYLCQFVSRHYGSTRQWLPPHRRRLWNDMYFQSRRDERIEGVVAIDTSGSCIDMLPKFFGELKGLMDSFSSYRLTVIQADAAVDKVDVYDSSENPIQLDTAEDIKFSGGGGTDYGPVFEYIDKEAVDPDFLIYIGDGYASMSYKGKPRYDVMWLLTKDGAENFCDFGRKVHFKENAWD